MERAELIERLKGYEWNDVEFKEARRDVPKSAYETVSAFANTEGGWLVFGVRDGEGGFEIVGVLEVDKVQGEFLTALRQHDNISAILDIRGELHQQGDADLLVFHVPRANRDLITPRAQVASHGRWKPGDGPRESPSFPRKRESILIKSPWIPAFAGMTG